MELKKLEQKRSFFKTATIFESFGYRGQHPVYSLLYYLQSEMFMHEGGRPATQPQILTLV